jgi:two-component system, sporulation sensor kinase E
LGQICLHIGLALELAWSHREVLEKRKLEQELAALQERLVQVDRLRLMGELFSGVMHKLNNPLAIVAGNLQLLKSEMGPEAFPRLGRYVENIDNGVHRSAATMHEFRQFMEIQRRSRRALDLRHVLRQTLALRQKDWNAAGIRVNDQLGEVPPVTANEEEMQHVFLNLLKNAEEAVGRSSTDRQITLASFYEPESKSVRIDIADNGPGIPPEIQPRIFESFFTTKSKGTGAGLGLMIARRIVEEHDGRIFLRTGTEAGAAFSIEMPAQPNYGVGAA